MTDIGSSDAVRIDPSRCLRMRFSGSGCSRCLAICPHGAITLADRLLLDPAQCRGCLLCTSVCPVGALEQRSDFSTCLEQLSRESAPILGCSRTHEGSHASVPCLGGLAKEHLLALCQTLPHGLTLNLSSCGDCDNNAMVPQLRQRLAELSQAGLAGGSRVVLADSLADSTYRQAAMDRRSFFKLVRSSVLRGAAEVLTGTAEQPVASANYGTKRLPARRIILNRVRLKLSSELAAAVKKQFDFRVVSTGACTHCQSCAAICPTGALQAAASDAPPLFDHLLCTGCGLCGEFCLDAALRMQPQ